MTKTTVQYLCDICGKEVDSPSELKKYTFPFISSSDDNDGMPMAEHIVFESAELCEDCLLKSTNLRCGFHGAKKRIEFWKE